MPVAATDRHDVPVPHLPPGQRSAPAPVQPGGVPHLGERGPPGQLVTPGAVPAQRMVHGEQTAICLDGVQPGRRRLAEVHPADVSECVGVPEAGGDLLARKQLDPGVAAGRTQLAVVADRVVVRDRQEVQTAFGSQTGELGHSERAVGVNGVRVEVACSPYKSVDGGQLSWWWMLGWRRMGAFGLRLRSGGSAGIHLRDDLVVEPARRDAVQPEHDVPCAGLELAGEVTRSGSVPGDHELFAGAAGPAPEGLWRFATQVEHTGCCLLYTSPSPRDGLLSRMPSSA